jgi:predicted  nucleic acid-binding Zn-ribbon protein
MADKVKKFTEDELVLIEGVQRDYIDIQNKFGKLQITRVNLEKQLEELNGLEGKFRNQFEDIREKEKNLVDKLTEKYGQGSLDPESGEFTPKN